MTEPYQYPGKELELFEAARNWKRYIGSVLRPYIQGSVLEVGAGIGETTGYLHHAPVRAWTCLEPDPALFAILQQKKEAQRLPPDIQLACGTLDDLAPDLRFDTILYIDVLEHIEADGAEVRKATERLSPGGRLIVLSPSYQFLYSPFDRAIGHYRRYNKKTLRSAAADPRLDEEKMYFLESSGLLLLLVNKLLLRKNYPGKAQVRLWDSVFIPVSRLLDRLTFHRMGKTIIGIWKKK
jgi:SAM-dependent methyltransferase